MIWGVRSPVKRLLVLAGCTVGQTQSCRRELTALARATAAKGVLSWPAGSSLLTRPSVFCRRAVTRGSQNSDSDPVTDVWPRKPSDARTLLPSVFRGAVSSCSPRASPTPSSVLGDPSPSALPRHAGSALCAPNSLLRSLLQWAMSSALMVSAVTHVRMTPESTAVSLLMDKAHRNLEAGRGSDAWEGWADEVR